MPRNAFPLLLLAFLGAAKPTAAADESALAIVDAGIQQSDDAPFVTTDYQFLPGEYLWVTFRVAGFAARIDEERGVRSIDLQYSIAPRDKNGVALVPPIAGEVKEQLGPEDKNWTPLKRASFLLPSLLASGDFEVHIDVTDLLAKSETAKDLPFRTGGVRLEHFDGVNVQRFRFLRFEDDREALETPAYRPGDTVFTGFDIAGFTLGPSNTYRLAYGVTVLRPDGKPFLQDPNAAQLSDSSFYPAQYVPASASVLTDSKSPRGEYVILLTVHDLISGKTSGTRRTFSLE